MSEDLRRHLTEFREAAAKLVDCIAAQQSPPPVEAVPSVRDCMTRKQLADYLQCSEQAIANWQNRAEYPLPHGYAGDTPRYFLAEIQQWSKDEAQRRANKTKPTARKPITSKGSARKMPPAVTATIRPKGDRRNGDIQALQGTTH